MAMQGKPCGRTVPVTLWVVAMAAALFQVINGQTTEMTPTDATSVTEMLTTVNMKGNNSAEGRVDQTSEESATTEFYSTPNPGTSEETNIQTTQSTRVSTEEEDLVSTEAMVETTSVLETTDPTEETATTTDSSAEEYLSTSRAQINGTTATTEEVATESDPTERVIVSTATAPLTYPSEQTEEAVPTEFAETEPVPTESSSPDFMSTEVTSVPSAITESEEEVTGEPIATQSVLNVITNTEAETVSTEGIITQSGSNVATITGVSASTEEMATQSGPHVVTITGVSVSTEEMTTQSASKEAIDISTSTEGMTTQSGLDMTTTGVSASSEEMTTQSASNEANDTSVSTEVMTTESVPTEVLRTDGALSTEVLTTQSAFNGVINTGEPVSTEDLETQSIPTEVSHTEALSTEVISTRSISNDVISTEDPVPTLDVETQPSPTEVFNTDEAVSTEFITPEAVTDTSMMTTDLESLSTDTQVTKEAIPTESWTTKVEAPDELLSTTMESPTERTATAKPFLTTESDVLATGTDDLLTEGPRVTIVTQPLQIAGTTFPSVTTAASTHLDVGPTSSPSEGTSTQTGTLSEATLEPMTVSPIPDGTGLSTVSTNTVPVDVTEDYSATTEDMDLTDATASTEIDTTVTGQTMELSTVDVIATTEEATYDIATSVTQRSHTLAASQPTSTTLQPGLIPDTTTSPVADVTTEIMSATEKLDDFSVPVTAVDHLMTRLSVSTVEPIVSTEALTETSSTDITLLSVSTVEPIVSTEALTETSSTDMTLLSASTVGPIVSTESPTETSSMDMTLLSVSTVEPIVSTEALTETSSTDMTLLSVSTVEPIVSTESLTQTSRADVTTTSSLTTSVFTVSTSAQPDNTTMHTTVNPTKETDIEDYIQDVDICHENATCINTTSGHACVCRRGFQGDGRNCSDIDECSMQPPVPAAAAEISRHGCSDVCVNTVGSYHCACPEYFTLKGDGKTCEAEESCTASANPCRPTVHSKCAVANGTYVCSCSPGIHLASNGYRCEDTDECSSGHHNCHASAQCTNTYGGFSCTCSDGYIGDGTNCTDVDECTSGTASCDENASCENTGGSYTCTCNENYESTVPESTGFMGQCREVRLFPDGLEGHRLFGNSTTEGMSPLIEIPEGMPMPGGRLCNSAYILENGVIVITTLKASQRSAVRPTYRHPTTDPNAFGETVCGVIAPFWADVIMGENYPSEVRYEVYQQETGRGRVRSSLRGPPSRGLNKNAILRRLSMLISLEFGTTDMMTYALVVTWKNMTMAGDPARDGIPTNTFQAVLTTDRRKTYALYLYDDRRMQWDPQISQDNLVDGKWPAFMGYIIRGKTGLLTVVEDENSRQKSSMENGQKNCSQPNVYCLDRKSEGGWIYRIDDNNATYVNPRKQCMDWYLVQTDVTDMFGSLPPCPTTAAHAHLDPRWKAAFDVSSGDRLCFDLNRPLSSSGGNMLCCYQMPEGAFIRNNRERSGTFERRERGSASYQTIDAKARDFCCLDYGSKYCDMYFEKRPMGSTEGYFPPRTSAAAGDPHILTLDRVRYSFNGLGEYLLCHTTPSFASSQSAATFSLQGRTKLVDVEPGKTPRATVFSAIGARSTANSVQMYLDEKGEALHIMIDDVNMTFTQYQGGQDTFDDGRLVMTTDSEGNVTSVKVIFDIGVSVEVKAGYQMLTYTAIMPSDLMGNLQGMMGNFNDNTTDEFHWPNGTAVGFSNNTNPSEEELYGFGESWSLKSVANLRMEDATNLTLFHFYPDGQSAATYGNDSFTPLFFDLGAMFENDTERQRAVQVCGGPDKKECLFDIALTGNEAVGVAAEQGMKSAEISNNVLGNTPPRLNVTSEIRAVVGQKFFLHITVEDDGQVSVSLTGPGEIDGNNTFRWTPEDTENVTIKFLAQDDMGATSMATPDVTVCSCQHGGACEWGVTSRRVAGFAVATCACPLGYTGMFCETDFDGCSIAPCYPGVNCTDSQAPLDAGEKEYTCGTCPTGMVGDGESCSDLDECVLPNDDPKVHACVNSVCHNTAPGYRCECHPGYEMTDDVRTCQDINECATANNCHEHAHCNNTAGGFTCACSEGFTGDGRSCRDVDECAASSGGDCSHLCVNTVGSFYCACTSGYTLGDDAKSCIDTDECVLDIDGCSHACTNTVSSFNCSCPDNFALGSDGKTCQASEPCLNTTCSPSDVAFCAVVSGNETCSCAEGYSLNSNGTFCEDIDECETSENCQGTNVLCRNLPGSYVCACASGFYAQSLNGSTTCTESKTYAAEIRVTNQVFTAELTDATSTQYKSMKAKAQRTLETLYKSVMGNSFLGVTIDGFKNGSVVVIFTLNLASNTTHNASSSAHALREAIASSGGGELVVDGNSVTVTDIDECTSNVTKLCHANADCTNTDGGYICTCTDGYSDGSEGGSIPGSTCQATSTPSQDRKVGSSAVLITFGVLCTFSIPALCLLLLVKIKKRSSVEPSEDGELNSGNDPE
ncbi:MUC4 [Branchiostoma lanceolatum]|uniref:MUC4 protein n=2 Tax=Branchiostoma lanceolatum TaxID=7740 RepID=A0A8K0ADD8_BRALA|nr:MUC4 [Branchiostoma lanceolatum]